MHFSQLKISEPIMRAIADLNYLDPTPIQVQAIPPLLEGFDMLGEKRLRSAFRSLNLLKSD